MSIGALIRRSLRAAAAHVLERRRRVDGERLSRLAYLETLDRLLEMAHANGAREERQRIALILNDPAAAGFDRLAWALAEQGATPGAAHTALVQVRSERDQAETRH